MDGTRRVCVGPRVAAHVHTHGHTSKNPTDQYHPIPTIQPTTQDLAAGDVHVLKYRVVRPLLLSEDVELI